jgi:hypothetical protein
MDAIRTFDHATGPKLRRLMLSMHYLIRRWIDSILIDRKPLKETARRHIESWVHSLGLGLPVHVIDLSNADELKAALTHYTHETPLARLLRLARRILSREFAEKRVLEHREILLEPLIILFSNLYSAILERTQEIARRPLSARGMNLRDLRNPPRDSEMIAFIEMAARYESCKLMPEGQSLLSEHVTSTISLRRLGESLEWIRRAFHAGAGWLMDSPEGIGIIMLPRFLCDESLQLHSEHSAAVAGESGWEEFWLHGVRVPGEVVLNPESISGEQILREQNVEVRRIMIERKGVERFLEESHPISVCMEGLGNSSMTLYKFEVSEGEQFAAVRLTCPSTKRSYLVRVPPDTLTPRAAVAWTFGLREQDYQPFDET